MRCAILLFCAGIMSATYVTHVPFYLALSIICAAVLCLLLLLIRLFDCYSLVQNLLAYSICFLFGVAWHLHWASVRLGERLPEALEGVSLQVTGVVVGLPERSGLAQQFQFRITRSPSGFYPRKVTLNYYGDALIKPGQTWNLSVRLNRPHGFANPGGFDYEGWLFQRGISARGYVRESTANGLIADGVREVNFAPSVWIHSLRYTLKARLERLIGDAPYEGLLIALVLGDRSAISSDNWNLFSATGSNHLFVISGLHIGLISGFCYYLCLLIGKVLRIGNVVPAQKFAAFMTLVAAFSYALVAGFTLPTQRAFIMIAVYICGLFWNARYLISFRLLLALLVVLVLNPLAITSSGFWLSFVAVAALLSFVNPVAAHTDSNELEPSLAERLRILVHYFVKPQIIVLTALAVPLIFFTGQLSLLSPLVNIVAIPVVGFLIVPLCFLALLLSFIHQATAITVLSIAHGCIALLMWFMQALARWSAGALQLQFSQPDVWQVFAMLLAVMLLLLPKAVCRRSLIIPLLLPLLPLPKSLGSAAEEEDSLRLHIVDVGQGLAVIVQTRAHALLYDSGANLSPDFNLGSAVVLPALRAHGIRRLDAVVISHGDNDHAGGLSGISPHIEIDWLISNRVDVNTDIAAAPCDVGTAWNWDGVTFRFLQAGLDFVEENNNSCVLQIRFGDIGILLPGDIEREAETALVLRHGDALDSTVLLAPHHGSLSSSSYGFLKKVRPVYVVFSSGYHNSFGHPHERVRLRYAEFGSLPLTTASTGMISFDFGGGEQSSREIVKPELYREDNFRYWR